MLKRLQRTTGRAGMATLFLPAIWLAFSAVRWLLALPIDQPLLVDETLYWQMARSFLAQGSFHVFGIPYDTPAVLYPILLSPLFLTGDPGASFDLARGLNAALASSVVFPAYGLARELSSPPQARSVAALSAAVPGAAFTALIVAENLYYPLFTLAFWLAYRVLAHGRERDAVACALVLFLGYFVKPHVLVLVAAYGAAVSLWAAAQLQGPRRGSLRRAFLVRAAPLAGIVTAMAVQGWLRSTSAPGTLRERLLGMSYARLFDYGDLMPDPVHLAGAALALLLTLALATGVLPLASLLAAMARVKRGEESLRWFLVLTGLVLAAMILVVARHTLQNDPRVLLNERYLFVLAPLLFTAFFAATRPAGRIETGIAAALLAGLLALLGPLADFTLYWSLVTDAPSLTGAYGLRLHLGSPWVGALGLVGLGLAATAALRRATRSPSRFAVLGIFLAVLGAGWYAFAFGPAEARLERFTELAARLDSHLTSDDRLTIVDRMSPRSRIDPRVVWQTGFWLDQPISIYSTSRGGAWWVDATGPPDSVDEGTSPAIIVAPARFQPFCPAGRPLPAVNAGLRLSITVLQVETGGCR